MSKSDEIREEQLKAAEASGIILDGLRRRVDPRLLSKDVARRFDIDERKAYTWVAISEDNFDASRRRIAAGGVAVLCLGLVAVLTGVLLRLFDIHAVNAPLVLGLAVGLPVSAIGFTLGLLSRRLARAG